MAARTTSSNPQSTPAIYWLPLKEGAAGDINASAATAAKARKRGHDVGRRCTGGEIEKKATSRQDAKDAKEDQWQVAG